MIREKYELKRSKKNENQRADSNCKEFRDR